MPSETLNRTEELVDKIGYSDDNTDEADLQAILEEAHQEMQSRVGRYFTEDKRLKKTVESGDLVNTFSLKFSPVLEVKEILINRNEVLDESNYTVDKQNGEVTIDQSFVDEEMYLGQIIRVKMLPLKFKNIELWRAVSIAKNQEVIQLEDSEENALHRNALRKAKRLENQVNRLSGSGSATDGYVRRGTK